MAGLRGHRRERPPSLVAAYARGLVCPDSYEHNLIAQAINEHFMDRGEDHPTSYQDIPFLR